MPLRPSGLDSKATISCLDSSYLSSGGRGGLAGGILEDGVRAASRTQTHWDRHSLWPARAGSAQYGRPLARWARLCSARLAARLGGLWPRPRGGRWRLVAPGGATVLRAKFALALAALAARTAALPRCPTPLWAWRCLAATLALRRASLGTGGMLAAGGPAGWRPGVVAPPPGGPPPPPRQGNHPSSRLRPATPPHSPFTASAPRETGHRHFIFVVVADRRTAGAAGQARPVASPPSPPRRPAGR